MQNVLLIAIAVSNLVVGIETSSDVEDVWLELGLLETSTSSDSNEDVQGDETVGTDCDHCCHASAHTVAFTVLPISLERITTSTSLGLSVDMHGRPERAPPLPPPIA